MGGQDLNKLSRSMQYIFAAMRREGFSLYDIRMAGRELAFYAQNQIDRDREEEDRQSIAFQEWADRIAESLIPGELASRWDLPVVPSDPNSDDPNGVGGVDTGGAPK